MCRAIKVLCVAPDPEALGALKRAAVGAEWELSPGAITEEEALAQLGDGRPHIMVTFGNKFAQLPAVARAKYPGMRIVADFEAPEVDEVAKSLEDVRPAIVGAPRPSGPIRSPK